MSLKGKIEGQAKALEEAEATIADLKAKLAESERAREAASNVVAHQRGELNNALNVIEKMGLEKATLHASLEGFEETLITVLGHFRVKTIDELLTLAENFKSEMVERMVRHAHEHVIAQIDAGGGVERGARRHAEILEDMRRMWTMYPYEPQKLVPLSDTPVEAKPPATMIPVVLDDGRKALVTALPDAKYRKTVRLVIGDGIYDWPVSEVRLAPYEEPETAKPAETPS